MPPDQVHRLFVRFVLTGSVYLKDLRRKAPLVAEEPAEAGRPLPHLGSVSLVVAGASCTQWPNGIPSC